MSTYSQIAWLPLAGGLTIVGLIASWLAWRRRGAAAGLRGVAWSLLPVAAYLTGAIKMLWQMGTAISSFAASFIFSPRVWSGVIVAGASAVLFVVSSGLRRRRGRKASSVTAPGAAGLPAAQPGTALKPAQGRPVKAKVGQGDDDEFDDVAQILRRHGIS
jgi:asparagine N-glycosylation enzyme membrane subunit Stt3